MSGKVLLNGSRFLTNDMGLEFFLAADGAVVCTLMPELRHEGPPGHMHGGFSASLLDEAMGAAAWNAGHQVVSVNLTTDFRAPVPIGAEISVSGRVDRIDGGKIHTVGIITLLDGRVAVEGRGLWVEMPQMFKDADFLPFGSARER